MTELLQDEVRTLRMLAGQLPQRFGLVERLCIQELIRHGFCTVEDAPRITPQGIRCLNEITGTVDLSSRRFG
jgi:hypothetical protein